MDNRKEQLSELSGKVQKSLDETKKSCNELVSRGLIEIVGREYMLTAKVYEALKSDVEYTRDKTVQYIKAKNMILEYLQTNDQITSPKIQEMCGFTKQQARSVIDKMRSEKLIDICRRGNKSFYVRLQCFEFSFELFLEKTRKKLEEQFPHNEEVILKLTKQNKCSLNNRQNQIFVVELAYKCNTKKMVLSFLLKHRIHFLIDSRRETV